MIYRKPDIDIVEIVTQDVFLQESGQGQIGDGEPVGPDGDSLTGEPLL